MSGANNPAQSHAPSAGARQAALLLHGVDPRERNLLLAELQPHERDSLQGLLEELRTLGLPRSPELVQQCLSASAPQPPTPRASDLAGSQGLGSMSGRAVGLLVKDEPEEIAVCALRLMGARKRAQALRRFDVPRRRRIQRSAATSSEVGRGTFRDRAVRDGLLERGVAIGTGATLSWGALRRSFLRWADRSLPGVARGAAKRPSPASE